MANKDTYKAEYKVERTITSTPNTNINDKRTIVKDSNPNISSNNQGRREITNTSRNENPNQFIPKPKDELNKSFKPMGSDYDKKLNDTHNSRNRVNDINQLNGETNSEYAPKNLYDETRKPKSTQNASQPNTQSDNSLSNTDDQNKSNSSEDKKNEESNHQNNEKSSLPKNEGLPEKDEGLKESAKNVPKTVIKDKAKTVAKDTAKKGAEAVGKFLAKNPYVLAFVGIVALILLLLLLLMAGFSGSSSYGASMAYESGGYWWPVGSKETTSEGGKLFARGKPEVVYISSKFGYRTDVPDSSNHTGIDIAQNPSNVYNIIASESGTVVNAVDGNSEQSFGAGYGNYVDIIHDDGILTRYGHLYNGSITVRKGEKVEQGQVIAKMGNSGHSYGTHVHFEVQLNGNPVDPLDYVSVDNPRPVATSGGGFDVLKTSLSKSEFVTLMKKYNYGGDYDKNFKNNADLIYRVSVQNNVNPELVVVTAQAEQRFINPHGSNNYWGIGCANESCELAYYGSLSEGIKGYAEYINKYATPGEWFYSSIKKTNEERKKARCVPGGYGPPETLEGVQSLWSNLGKYWVNPGDWTHGGCIYLKSFIDEGFMPEKYTKSYYNKKCGSSTRGCSGSGCIKTNTCEQSDYTKWQVDKKIKIRKKIFKI